MDATLSDFRLAFPEFAGTSDPRVQFFIDEATDELSAPTWGMQYGKAALTYAAHLLCLSESRVASATTAANGATVVPQSGAIQTATVEGTTVAFATSNRQKSANEEWLAQSNYGQQFAALRRRVLPRGSLSW